MRVRLVYQLCIKRLGLFKVSRPNTWTISLSCSRRRPLKIEKIWWWCRLTSQKWRRNYSLMTLHGRTPLRTHCILSIVRADHLLQWIRLSSLLTQELASKSLWLAITRKACRFRSKDRAWTSVRTRICSLVHSRNGGNIPKIHWFH